MKEEYDYIIYTDGGSRGNPGEAAYGFVIYQGENKIFEKGEKLGIQTNNYAEYTGIIEALRFIEKKLEKGKQTKRIKFFMDSKLAVEQLSGHWKIKSESIRSLYFTIKQFEKKLEANINYCHVPREQNKEADLMVNLALDGQI